MAIFYVLIGGFIGAISRFIIGDLLIHDPFPFATLIVNCIGCFLISFAASLIKRMGKWQQPYHLFLIVGFTRSFTTFSTLAVELIQLVQHGFIFYAAIYLTSSLLFDITFVLFGLYVANLIVKG